MQVISSENCLQLYKKQAKLMGNQFEISAVTTCEQQALIFIDAAIDEIKRIEKLLTTYNEHSETCIINKYAGIAPVAVSRETFALVERAQRIAGVTQGAFDLSYGSVDRQLWNFDTTATALPDSQTAKKMVRLINYKNILLDESQCTVFLKEKGMRIGFGGIGKGYAADRAKQVMQEMGCNSGIVNASGDLTAWGCQPDKQPWTIGIVNPDFKQSAFSYLSISGLAVATSGTYEKYIEIGGKRYSHTINPKTGLPVTGIKSVTIIAPNAEVADAMATPVMVMGVGPGLDMINQLHNIEAIVIDDNNKLYCSKNIRVTK